MTRRMIALAVVFLAPAVGVADDADGPADVDAAMQELWRRGSCLLSSVHQPAARESAVPADVGDTPVVHPRVLARTGAVLAWAVDAGTIWAADDQSLHETDAATGLPAGRFDRSDGLPDAAVQSIAPAPDAVYLATRGGLARLDRRTRTIAEVEGVRFRVGRLAAGDGGVWLVSDAGAWHCAPGRRNWRKLPDFPGQTDLRRVVAHGFWSAWWRRRAEGLIPSVLATSDGLYAVVLDRLVRFGPDAGDGGRWTQLGRGAWRAAARGRTVWALTTGGVLRCDPSASPAVRRFRAGKGPAAGRPVAMAPADGAFFLASEPDYDPKAGRFVGGGLSRMDLASGTWTVAQTVGGRDVRFATALAPDGHGAWAGCILYDRVVRLGAHPGMAHVKRWRPHAVGIGLLRHDRGRWTLTPRTDLKTEKRIVMGQKGTAREDLVGPASIEGLRRVGDRVWGIYRMTPADYYAGYYVSAGCLAVRSGGGWRGIFDARTDALALAGEFPHLMLISHSHGERVVLAEGHPVVLSVEAVAGRAWAVCESGLFVHEAVDDAFRPAVRQAPRVYWRTTAAAAAKDAVWFGGDGGTISRFDRRTGRLELVGVAPGRKVIAMAAAAGGVVARTAAADVPLPVGLRDAPKLPRADRLLCSGRTCRATDVDARPPETDFHCRRKGSYLYRGRRRVAFLKGVFRPRVLCEDRIGGRLWLSTYSGVASIPLPERAEK